MLVGLKITKFVTIDDTKVVMMLDEKEIKLSEVAYEDLDNLLFKNSDDILRDAESIDEEVTLEEFE
jgi:hypothetical protein